MFFTLTLLIFVSGFGVSFFIYICLSSHYCSSNVSEGEVKFSKSTSYHLLRIHRPIMIEVFYTEMS
jgi:hypothetical protein